MPNHTSNRLTVVSDDQTFNKIRKFVQSDKENFSLNKIIPMPEELNGTRCPCLIKTQAEIDELKKQRKNDVKSFPAMSNLFIDEVAITQETYDERIKLYGVSNWYDWSVSNWGTKWDCYDIGKWEDGKICFYTAWAPPTPAIVELSKRFPKAQFTLEFCVEGGNGVGSMEFDNGEVSEYNHDWNSEAGIALRKSLGMYFEEEMDEEEIEEKN